MAGRKNSRITPYCITRTLAVLVMLPTLLYGQQQSSDLDSLKDWVTLQEVEVNALALSTSKFEYGGMIGTIGVQKLLLGSPAIASDEMNKIPGVYWHSGALNTNRITIRGIGSRSPFSTNKIRAYYGDIPLTDGGGETTLEDIDLSFVGGVEVQKGANSSLYGSGLGGTIFLNKPTTDNSTLRSNLSLGPFGFVKKGIIGQFDLANGDLQIGYQSQKSDGYRNNNSFDRQTFFTSYTLNLGKNEFKFIGLFLQQKAFIPSSLGASDFKQDPEKAAFTWGAAKGFEDYDRWLVGISWERNFNATSKMVSSFYTVGRDAFEPRPFNILEEKNQGLGIRTRWDKTGNKISVSVGIEGYSDTYEASTFENLLPQDGSEQGSILSETRQPRKYLNLFSESKYYIGSSTILSTGANLNVTSYEIEDALPSALNSDNTLEPILSPRISLTHGFNEKVNVFATLSHGFSPLSVDDSTNPDGSLNEDIKPETGWNRELGFKLADGRTNLELSFYSMNIQNLLVTRRTAEDVIFGVNAGKTRHNGIEVDVESLFYRSEKTQLVADFSYSLSDFQFKSFVDDQDDFSGNQLTGVPKHQLNLDVRHKTDWFFSGLSYQFVDQIPLTDGNDIFSESYQLINLHAGVDMSFGEKWSANLIFRVINVLDEKYASMLSINANSFGGSEPRYFYPGLPRNYQASFTIAYEL